jgi:hypothetical protein
MNAAADLVDAWLRERHLELNARLLQTAIQIQALARHGDVVRRAIIIDEYHDLTLFDAQFLNAELQSLLCDSHGSVGADGAHGEQSRQRLSWINLIGHYAQQLRYDLPSNAACLSGLAVSQRSDSGSERQ